MNLPNLSNFDPQVFFAETLVSPTGQTVVLAIVAFFVILLIALSRRFLIHSSMQGVWAGMFIGVLLIVGIEAGIVYGFKEFLNGEKAEFVPPNIRAMLSNSQQQVTQVLGVDTERKIPTAQSVVSDFEDLPKLDSQLVKNSICRTETQTQSGDIK